MDSTANSAGDMSNLMKIGDDKEALFARIVVASIIQWNLTEMGLGFDCCTLNENSQEYD